MPFLRPAGAIRNFAENLFPRVPRRRAAPRRRFTRGYKPRPRRGQFHENPSPLLRSGGLRRAFGPVECSSPQGERPSIAPAGRWAVATGGAEFAARRTNFFAPAGRWAVATGGAEFAARRTKRNPWRVSSIVESAPKGQRDGSRGDVPQTCSSNQVLDINTKNACMPFLRPAGAIRNFAENLFPRVPRRRAAPRRRFTRGYNPRPRRGQFHESLFPASQTFRPVGASSTRASSLHRKLSGRH
jgi:hypothetical protein